MRFVIVGAGNAGRNLALRLCEEKHDVVVIDSKQEPLSEISAQMDVMTILGEGSSPVILKSAGIEKSDLLVSVTKSDEVNILACMYGKAFGVKYTVARVSKSDYLHSTSPFNLYSSGVDLLVSEKEECSSDMFNILRMPGALEVVDMIGGRVLVTGMKVHMDSPLLRSTLKAFPQPELLSTIRFIALMRGQEMIIPRGDTQPLVGDDVYMVGRPNDLKTFMAWAWPENTQFQKVIVAGGGDTGLLLAQKLEGLENIQVMLVEKDDNRAQHCSGLLNKALVIKGDALEDETFENCGITDKTAFAATTGEDEKNVLSCLLAQDHGAAYTLAEMSKPQYVPVINRMSLLDRAVSPYLSMVNAILHFVRGKNIRSAAVLYNLPGELMEVALSPKSKLVGKSIKQLKLPESGIIATVMRGGDVHVATGEWVLEAGDRLVVFSGSKAAIKVEAIFRK